MTKKLNEGYLNMTSIPTINTGVADDWYLPEVEDDEFNCGIDCNVAPMVGAQGGQTLSTMAGGEELPAEEDAGLDYLLQMAGVDGTEETPAEVVSTEIEEVPATDPSSDLFNVAFDHEYDDLFVPSESDYGYDLPEIPVEEPVDTTAPAEFDPYDSEIDAFDGIMDTLTEEPVVEPVPDVAEEPVETEVPAEPETSAEAPIEAEEVSVEEPVSEEPEVAETPVETEVPAEVSANPEDMVLEKQPETDDTEAQQIKDYLVHNKEVLYGPASAKIEQYRKSLDGKSIEELRVEAEEVSPNWKKYIGKYKITESVKVNESENLFKGIRLPEDKEEIIVMGKALKQDLLSEDNADFVRLHKGKPTEYEDWYQLWLQSDGNLPEFFSVYKDSINRERLFSMLVELGAEWFDKMDKLEEFVRSTKKITESVEESEERLQGEKVEPTEEDLKQSGLVTAKIFEIEWDCDGENPEDLGLPTRDFTITFAHDGSLDYVQELSDALSDEYGYCHFGYDYEIESIEPDYDEESEKEDWLLGESVEKLNESTMLEVEGNELFTIYKDPETNIFRLYDKRDNDWVEESEDIAVLEKIMEDESEHLEVSSDTEAEELNDKISELSEYGIIYTGDLKELAEKLGKNPQELEDIAIELGYKVEGLLQEEDFGSDFDKLAGIESDEPVEKQEVGGKKYIISAYEWGENEDEDGAFYGYFARHPDDPENKSFSYYVNEIKDARKFDSPDEAYNMIERFEDGSELYYHVEEIDDTDPEGTTEVSDDVQEEVPEGQQILTEEGEELSDEDMVEIEDNETLDESADETPIRRATLDDEWEVLFPETVQDCAKYACDKDGHDYHFGADEKSINNSDIYSSNAEKTFNHYKEQGPLFILINNKTGKKYLTCPVAGVITDEKDIYTTKSELENWIAKTPEIEEFLPSLDSKLLGESAEKIEAINVDVEPEEVKVEETKESDLKHEIPENDMIKDNVDTGEEVKFDEPVEAENGEIETKEFEVKETTEAELKHEIKDNEPIEDSIETGEEIKVETPVEAENVDLEPEEKADKYVESVIYSVKMKDDKIVECKTEEEFNKLLSESVKDIKSVVII